MKIKLETFGMTVISKCSIYRTENKESRLNMIFDPKDNSFRIDGKYNESKISHSVKFTIEEMESITNAYLAKKKRDNEKTK